MISREYYLNQHSHGSTLGRIASNVGIAQPMIYLADWSRVLVLAQAVLCQQLGLALVQKSTSGGLSAVSQQGGTVVLFIKLFRVWSAWTAGCEEDQSIFVPIQGCTGVFININDLVTSLSSVLSSLSSVDSLLAVQLPKKWQ
jgi:hypothetical protein